VSIERCFVVEKCVVCVLSLLHSILSNTLSSHSNIHTRTRKSHSAHLHSALNSTQLCRRVQPDYWELGCLECHEHEGDVPVSIERCFGDEVFVVCVLSLLHSILSNTFATHSNIHTRKSHLAHLLSALDSTQSVKSLQPEYWELECLECH
jgi:hypothetical protein